MHMANAKRRWTIDELHGLPEDGNKYELIKGQLFVTPAPSDNHETIGARLTRLIDPYVAAKDLGLVHRPRAIGRIGKDSEVEPDLMVRQPQSGRRASWSGRRRRFSSSRSRRQRRDARDRFYKRKVYAEAGILECWMVDSDDRTICVALPGHEDVITRDTLTWHPDGLAGLLTLMVADVFGSVHRREET